MKECKYRLPCNWCDKFNKKCEEVDYYKLPDPNICLHDWILEKIYACNSEESTLKYRGKFVCRKCHAVEIRDINKT